MINQQPGKCALSSDDMIALKKAGVSDKIRAAMAAMIVRNEAAKRASPNPATAPTALALHDATPIRLRLARGLTFTNIKPGEMADFEIMDDLRIDGVLVIAYGWRASATIIEAEPKTRLGRGGKLGVSLSYLPLLNGNKVAMRATREGALTDGAPAPAEALARAAAPSLLFVFGRDETFAEGTAILLRITRAPWSHVWHTRRRDAFHHQAGTRHVQSRVLSREVYTI